MRIQFTPLITRKDIQPHQIAHSRNLDIIRRHQPMCASNSSLGDQPRSVAWLGAPRDFYSLGISDRLVRSRRGPETEIGERVHVHILTHRRLTTPRPTLIRSTLSLLRLRGHVRRSIVRAVLSFYLLYR